MLLIIVLACGSAAVWFYNLDGASRASFLLVALLRYREKNNVYPNDLNELVPEYLSTIPRPSWRHEYYYLVNESRSEFSINFDQRGEAIGDGFCGYSSSSMKWDCTDSIIVYP